MCVVGGGVGGGRTIGAPSSGADLGKHKIAAVAAVLLVTVLLLDCHCSMGYFWAAVAVCTVAVAQGTELLSCASALRNARISSLPSEVVVLAVTQKHRAGSREKS